MFGKNNIKEKLVSIYVHSYFKNFSRGEVNKKALIEKVQPLIYSIVDQAQLKSQDIQSVEELDMGGSSLVLKNGWYLSFVPNIDGKIDFVSFSQIYPNNVTDKKDFFSIKFRKNSLPKVADELTDINYNGMCFYRFYTGDVGSRRDQDNILNIGCYYSKRSYESYLPDEQFAIPVDNKKFFFHLVNGGVKALQSFINESKNFDKSGNHHK